METEPRYYTVGELQRMVGHNCKSRNRPSLLKRLGLPDVPRPDDMKHDGRLPGDKPRVAPAIARKAKAKPAKKVKFTKPKPSKATVTVTYKGDVSPAKVKKSLKQYVDGTSVAVDLHATALAYVTAAMARKPPPSLRALCEELRAGKVQKPRGGTKWLPSSVQNLMRQVGK